MQEPNVLSTSTKNVSLGELLEGGTGNQTGEMIGRNVTHRGEKIKGTLYTEEKLAAEWKVKHLCLKKIIEKL